MIDAHAILSISLFFELKRGETMSHATPQAASGKTVHVTVPTKVFYNLESMQKVTEALMTRLGHTGCCSGFDVRFHVEDSFVVDANLNVREAPYGGT
jgi:hypothetical protein